jgi:hypothetical protein
MTKEQVATELVAKIAKAVENRAVEKNS